MLEESLLLDQKLGKITESGCDACALAETEAFLLEICQILLDNRLRQHLWLEGSRIGRMLRHPFDQVTQDAQRDYPRARGFP